MFNLPAGIPLSEFTTHITRAVSSSPDLFNAWVIAELSDVRFAGGHCYMELIEKNQSGQTVAKLRATIWQSYLGRIRQKFFQMAGRDITTGLKVLLKGNVNHHSLYGLAFNITDIDPSYTLGDLERLRSEILMQLRKEGILERNKGVKMPEAPQRIAVISAQGAAGYGDFINQLTSNREGFVFYPFLFPCVMQGERVSSSIREALQLIESMPDFWDCVAIVRGGGATTDMNGFDDYELARAIALCGLPVVVGIGHERDRNVLDEIAHTRLKTPTAVAGFFIDRLREAYQNATSCFDRIREYVFANITGEERRLSSIASMLPQLAARRVVENRSWLEKLAGTVPMLVDAGIKNEKTRLEGRSQLLRTLQNGIIENAHRRLMEIREKIKPAVDNNLSLSTRKLENLESLVKALDPMNTLRRGYSITRIGGKVITDFSEIKEGDTINTKMANFEIESKVVEARIKGTGQSA